MDNARERRVWSFVSDSIRDLRRLTRGPTTSLHIVKPSWLSRGGLGCSEPRYVKSYRRKQIICRWGSRLLSPVMCVYIYVYLAVQLNYIAYRFRIANKWRWVQVVLIDLKAVDESGISKDEQQDLFIFLDKCGIGFVILVDVVVIFLVMRIIGRRFVSRYDCWNIIDGIVGSMNVLRAYLYLHKLTKISEKWNYLEKLATYSYSMPRFTFPPAIRNARCDRSSISIHWKTFNKREDRGIVCIPVTVTSGIRVIIWNATM